MFDIGGWLAYFLAVSAFVTLAVIYRNSTFHMRRVMRNTHCSLCGCAMELVRSPRPARYNTRSGEGRRVVDMFWMCSKYWDDDPLGDHDETRVRTYSESVGRAEDCTPEVSRGS